MKKLWSMFLALTFLLSMLAVPSALAEEAPAPASEESAAAETSAAVPESNAAEAPDLWESDEMGLSFPFGEVEKKTDFLVNLSFYSITNRDPYAAIALLNYYILDEELLTLIRGQMAEATADEKASLASLVNEMGATIGYVVTIAAPTPDSVFTAAVPQEDVTEFAVNGDYHYFFVKESPEAFLASMDLPTDAELDASVVAEMASFKEQVRQEVASVQQAAVEALKTAKTYAPVDPLAPLVGQVLRFESVDLDGNPVKSEDLLKNNKVTMVNLWGTWCPNCVNEMAELAEIHKRLQEKGCGIVGIEWERVPIAEVKEAAVKLLTDSGVTYPNVIFPENNDILGGIHSFPTTLFVDSEGKILCLPIEGAAVAMYEPTVEKLLAREAVEPATESGATKSAEGKYRVFVFDEAKVPVEGAMIQFCDDTTCSVQLTDKEGVAAFETADQKVYDIHVLKAPEGYAADTNVYKTQDVFSDVSIYLKKAQ